MPDEIARVRKQWQPVIQAIIAAADWGDKYATQLEPFLNELERQDAWRPLAATFRRLLAGERDAEALLTGLDGVSGIVVGDVLRALGVDAPMPDELDSADLTPVVEEIFARVAFACRDETPVVYGEEMYAVTQKMAEHPTLDPELRELGRVLHRILAGERAPELSALTPHWAARVRELLRALG